MVANSEINEIVEELDADEIESNLVNNIISKPEKFSESSGRNIHFMKI